MIPLRDNIPSRTTPFVCYAMIGLCGVTFLLQLGRPQMIEQLGMIPARVVHPDKPVVMQRPAIRRTPFGDERTMVEQPAAESLVPAWLTPLTCIFLHGGWLHIIGNLWFLYIFGDNVEDRFGHWGFLLLYLGCGVAASLAHLASDPASTMPTIGASGAIAGVMGSYFVLYPRARVVALVPIFVILYTVVLPAPVFLGIWFLLQFVEGMGGSTGVAWWAHVGGFVVGTGSALLLKAIHVLRPPVQAVRADSSGRYW